MKRICIVSISFVIFSGCFYDSSLLNVLWGIDIAISTARILTNITPNRPITPEIMPEDKTSESIKEVVLPSSQSVNSEIINLVKLRKYFMEDLISKSEYVEKRDQILSRLDD